MERSNDKNVAIKHKFKRSKRDKELSPEKQNPRKKKVLWTEETGAHLLQLWDDHATLINKSINSTKVIMIFKEMSSELKNRGFNYTWGEIQYKIHNMTNKYKLEKRNIENSGGVSEWQYYDAIHSIMGGEKEIKNEESNSAPDFLTPESFSETQFEYVYDVDSLKEDAEQETHERSDNQDESMYSVVLEEDEAPEKTTKHTEKRKNKKSTPKHISNMLKILKYSTDFMRQEAEDARIMDAKMIKLQKQLLEVERERNEIIKQLLT